MGDPKLRTSEQRVEIATHIALGIMGRDETEPHWLPVAPLGVPHQRCELVRSETGRRRCLDARCDRCWPDLCPTCQGKNPEVCSNGFHYLARLDKKGAQ